MVELNGGVCERSIGEDDVADHGEGQGEQGVGVEFDGREKGEAREEEEKEKCDEEVEGGEGYLGVAEGGGLEDAFVDEDLDWGLGLCEKDVLGSEFFEGIFWRDFFFGFGVIFLTMAAVDAVLTHALIQNRLLRPLEEEEEEEAIMVGGGGNLSRSRLS